LSNFLILLALFLAHNIFSSREIGISPTQLSTFSDIISIFSHLKYTHFSEDDFIAFTLGGDFVQIARIIIYFVKFQFPFFLKRIPLLRGAH